MNEKILLVEDNSQNMRLLEILLRSGNYFLFEAIDGEEAMEVAVREKPHLIVMDMQLPRLSGLEVTRKLRKMPAFDHVPIIALTAYAMKGDKEKFIEAGCDAYLSKPINIRELPKIIVEMLRENKHEVSVKEQ